MVRSAGEASPDDGRAEGRFDELVYIAALSLYLLHRRWLE
jgi:hypothetical protein